MLPRSGACRRGTAANAVTPVIFTAAENGSPAAGADRMRETMAVAIASFRSPL
jgi:hypothetical protein